ncbi:MAG: exodeoxyribonuclease VII large subunit [Bacilli bacterium]
MENNYLTVSALNKYIAYKFDTDNALKNVLIQGEISNFRISKGHLYFSLKDEESEIRAIMFGSNARSLAFIPVDGMMVLIKAVVSVYPKGGTYSLNVNEMRQSGLGESYLNFLRLKEKLQKEGLFDQDKKLPIPSFIEHIAVITSENGDAINDITSTIFKRFPIAKVYMYPALVQGVQAPKSLIAALKKANEDRLGQVIIIARGGGSVEDLSCFNDEQLARAIFASKIPTVSGVGHEADFTICDFVASLRAPTPTGAAVLLTKSQAEIAQNINEKSQLLHYYYKRILEQKYFSLQNLVNAHYFKNFIEVIKQKENTLSQLTLRLQNSSPNVKINNLLNTVDNYWNRLKAFNIEDRLNLKINYVNDRQNQLQQLYVRQTSDRFVHLTQLFDKLNLLNPKNIMKKGYTLTYQNGQLITNVLDVNLEQNLNVLYYDGEIVTKPIKKSRKEE